VHTESQEEKVRVKLVDPKPLHPLLCYPGTNRPLRAVAVRADGSLLWPLLGGDGDDDEGSDDGGKDEGDDSEEDEEDADDTDADEDKSSKKKTKKSGPVSREEFDAVTNRLSAADRRRAAAEKEAAELRKAKEDEERKGKPELENVKKDLETVTRDHEKLQGRYKKLALTNAFLIASQSAGISWHNPKVAQAAGEFDELEIDEDGSVEGIEAAVKALAKKHKYLVNVGKADEDDEDGEDKKPARRGASGSGVGSVKTAKGKQPKGQLTKEELIKRFPALKR
jgi:hypothetical protein